MARRLFDETAKEAGAAAVSVYLDIASFYDSIQPRLMIRELPKHGLCPFRPEARRPPAQHAQAPKGGQALVRGGGTWQVRAGVLRMAQLGGEGHDLR